MWWRRTPAQHRKAIKGHLLRCDERSTDGSKPEHHEDDVLAEAEKLNLPLVDPVSGPDAEKIIASLHAAPPALVARTQAMVAQ